MIFLIYVLLSPQEPIHVSLGDPVLSLNLTNWDGETTKADHVLNTGFIIFLSTGCGACWEDLPRIEEKIGLHYEALFLFLNEEKNNISEIKRMLPDRLGQVYFVDQEPMLELNIKKTPSLLGYEDGFLKIAYHGSLSEKYLSIIISQFKKPVNLKRER